MKKKKKNKQEKKTIEKERKINGVVSSVED